MNRKGQLTIFIVIGLILAISVGTYFSFRSKVTEFELAPELAKVEEIPSQFQEVEFFITRCIEKTAEEGIKLLGAQGGYIDLDKAGIMASIEPTDGSAVYFSQGSELKLPYWFHLESDNKCSSCTFTSSRPELYRGGKSSIEEQIDDYINEKLVVCLEDFSALKREGYTFQEFNTPKTTTRVRESDVVIYVDYPLNVNQDGAETEINQFIAYIPVDLKGIYDLATHVTNLQNEHHFIEDDALNLIVGFSGKDKNKLPPMSATNVGVSKPIYWQKDKVRENIEDILMTYIPLLQVEGTLNFAPISIPGNELMESVYNQAMLIPNDKAYDIKVSFDYLGWPIYFDLNCDGGVCTSEATSVDLIPNFGLERYNFAYDLSFPVMVELRDPAAFKQQGYEFRFMLEANIRNNEVLGTEFISLEAAGLPNVSMLCDLEKRNSGEITIDLIDDMTGQGIDDVIVSFKCGDETCLIGITENGRLTEKFPVCFGGIINFAREGYLGYSDFLNTELDQDGEFEVMLSPIMTKQFRIKKKRLIKNPEGWVFVDTPAGLTRNESAFITLTRVSELGDGDFSTVSEYFGGISEIEIAPGTYSIESRLSTTEPYIIPAEERCEETILGMEECYTLDKFEFNKSFANGGASLDYEFTHDDLKNDIIVFYVLNTYFLGIPLENRKVEDLEMIGKIEEYSNQYQLFLRPTFEDES